MLINGKTLTTLTLTDNTQLTNFAGGDAITEVTSTGTAGDATGTVGSVDAVAKTITLSASAGTWDVGSAVKGPLKTQTITVTPNSDVITNVAVVTGPVYSSGTYRTQPSSPATKGNEFKDNDDTANYCGVAPNGYKWEPPTPIAFADKVEIYTLVAGSTIKWNANGNPWVTSATAGWYTLASGGGTLNYIEADWGTSQTQSPSKIRVDGRLLIDGASVTQLTFATAKDLVNFAGGDVVNQDSGGPASGTVASVDATAKTMTFGGSTGTWGPANTGKYVIGPTKTVPAANVKLYCKLDAAGAVSDLQSADPGFTAWTPAGTGPYTGTVTFPATLPTGNAPDADLPAGTTITVEVQATNTAGTDSAKSNTVTPA